MAITPFSINLKNLTDHVHVNWRDAIYPPLYGVSKEAITYGDDLPSQIVRITDGWLGIDRLYRVKYKGLRDGILRTSQERFRSAEQWQSCQDLTVTVWNNTSNHRGELYKMAAMDFVYGYYHLTLKRLVEVIVVDAPDLILAIAQDQIQSLPNSNPRSNQPFAGYLFTDLKKAGLVRLHLKEENGLLVPQSRSAT